MKLTMSFRVATVWSLFGATILLAAATPLSAQPVITIQPADQTVHDGSTAFFTVSAAGMAPLRYQWRKDGADILGATGATCALGLARIHQAGSYTVVVTDPVGSVTSAVPAVLTVSPVVLGAVVAWGLNSFPVDAAVPAGAKNGVGSIAAGKFHNVALKSDGSVLAWGYNSDGQSSVPIPRRPKWSP